MNRKKYTSDEERDNARKDKMREYRNRYWQEFQKTRKRIFGTVSNEEYEAVKAKAERIGQSAWQVVFDGYRRDNENNIDTAELPKLNSELQEERIEAIRELTVQMIRIGSNINQIARATNSERTADTEKLLEHLDYIKDNVEEMKKQYNL